MSHSLTHYYVDIIYNNIIGNYQKNEKALHKNVCIPTNMCKPYA